MSNVSNIKTGFDKYTTGYIKENLKSNYENNYINPASILTEEIDTVNNSQIYEMGSFVDDILNAISLAFGGNLTKNIGIECFKSLDFESIPDKDSIKKVYLTGPCSEYINVQLKTGEIYRFEMTNNEIVFNNYIDEFGNSFRMFINIDFSTIKNFTKTVDGKIIVDLKSDSSYVFKYENGKYLIDSIKLPENIQFCSDITDGDIEYVKNMLGDYWIEGTTVNGYTTFRIPTKNGNRLYKLYWIGSTTNYYDFIVASQKVFEALESYPDNVKDYLNMSPFKGFIFGTSLDIGAFGGENVYGAFAHSQEYVFFNNTPNETTGLETVYHEMGHIFDCMYGQGVHNSLSSPEVEKLFHDYDKNIENLGSLTEFFADLSDKYFIKADELKTLFPECYDYIKNFYDNL